MRAFAGLDAREDAMPDETTSLKFRRWLKRQPLAPVLFDETAAQWAVVEPPFRILKRQCGDTQVRYRGLFKNGPQRYLLFALGNRYQVRGALRAA